MNVREVGWLIFLVGLPFAHLLFRPHLDIWHGQAVWAQGWIITLFALSLGSESKPLTPNRPLAAFVAWIGLITLWAWVHTIIKQKIYPVPMLQGVGHLLLLVMVYSAAMTTWTTRFVGHLTRWMAYMGIVVLLYCGLQLLNLDQFFTQLDTSIKRDALVGTVGNPSHLATHLSLLLPLCLLWTPWWSIAVIGVLLMTQSLGGQVAALAIGAWWVWHTNRRWLWVVGLCGLVGGVWLLTHLDSFNPHGRLKAWGMFYQMFQQRPITGLGAGSIMEFSRTITDGTNFFFGWRHVHNEFFQAAIEYGVIGVGFIGWMMWELVGSLRRLHKTPLVVALSAILIAFGMNSLVNFPAHLWVTGSYAFVAYCGLRVLAEGT